MVSERPGWNQIQAVAEGRVYPFNDDLVSRPGPRMVDGLEEMVKIFHPQLAEELK
jgi:iron complex transport system substrate-binding protein